VLPEQVSNTYQEINMTVHELVPHAVSEEERHPTVFNKWVWFTSLTKRALLLWWDKKRYNVLSVLSCPKYQSTHSSSLTTFSCRRARVFRARVPPDQLNPQGATNGNLDTFMPTQGVCYRHVLCVALSDIGKWASYWLPWIAVEAFLPNADIWRAPAIVVLNSICHELWE